MFAQIETAMLDRLKAAADAGALGYAWKTLESYPENWDDYFETKGQVNPPAAWAVFAGIERSDDTNDGPLVTFSMGLTVAARSYRNEEATRHGHVRSDGTREVGSYQLMLDAVGLLHGCDLDLDISPLKLVTVNFVNTAGLKWARNASLFAIQFRAQTTIPLLPFDLDEPVDFTVFHANWDVPPHGGIDRDSAAPGVQLPDDVHADATDHLELPRA